MSELEEKNIDTLIEELLNEYAGQNEALEKILEKIAFEIENKEDDIKEEE